MLAFSRASRSAAGQVQRNGRGDFPLAAIANVLAGSPHKGHPNNHVISSSDTIRALFSRDSAIIRLVIERWSVTGAALQGALTDVSLSPELQLVTSVIGHFIRDLNEFLGIHGLADYFLDLLASFPSGGPAIARVTATDVASGRLGLGLSPLPLGIFHDEAGAVHAVDSFPPVAPSRDLLSEHRGDPIESKLAIVVNNFTQDEKARLKAVAAKPKREDKKKKKKPTSRVKDPRSVAIDAQIKVLQDAGNIKPICFQFNSAGAAACTKLSWRAGSSTTVLFALASLRTPLLTQLLRSALRVPS